jgi:hypothetical protein
MTSRVTSLLLLAAVIAAGSVALFQSTRSAPVAEHAKEPPPPEPTATAHSTAADLPPGHPPMNSAAPGPAPSDEPSAIHWKAPESWQTAPNPNAMRIATYRVPAAPGDSEGAEATVARAGGTPEANIARWIGQFSDAGRDKRTETVVRGLKVHVVEVSGTYLSGGMMGGAASPHPDWTLVGAVIDAPGSPYFFKLTGPKATVARSRASFDAWTASVTPG